MTGKTEQEHVVNLRTVLQPLENAGLRLNQQKCEFFRSSVTYLGHRLDLKGLHSTADKVEAVRNAPRPTNVKEFMACLGIVNYYDRFMQNRFFETGTVVWVAKEGCEVGVEKPQEETFIRVKDVLQ